MYTEMKGEEKLRLIYEKKQLKLKYQLDDQGSESEASTCVDESINKMEAKLSIFVTSIDAISKKTQMIRDTELGPQIIDLIKGLMRMWESMLDCHKKQFQALLNANVHNLILKTESDVTNIATKDLFVQLSHWSINFHKWAISQKSYVQSLNDWLMKWHRNSEVNEAFDRRVSNVTNEWNNALAKISDTDNVAKAIQNFAMNLGKIQESQEKERIRKLNAENLRRDSLYSNIKVDGSANVLYYDDEKELLLSFRKEYEERTKQHEIEKEINKLVILNCLKSGLLPIFKALKDFMSETVEAYGKIRLGAT